MDNIKPTAIPDSDPSRMVFIPIRQEIPKPKSIEPGSHMRPTPQKSRVSYTPQPHQETEDTDQVDHIEEIKALLNIAQTLANQSGREILAEDLGEIIAALHDPF